MTCVSPTPLKGVPAVSIRELIFSKHDIPTEQVEVPEWGITLEVRGMTGEDRIRIIARATDTETGMANLQMVYPEIVIACTYDPETGERVFEDGDRDALMSKSAQAIDRLANPGMTLSGLTKEAQDAQAADFPEESD